MRPCKSLIAAIFVLTIPNPVMAESPFPSFMATYRVKISALRGEMQMSLTQTDENYSAKSIVVPRGLARIFLRGKIEEQADFTISDGSLEPHHYESVDSIARHDRAISMDFDYVGRRAIGTRNGEPFELPIETMAFDRVSIQYALMLALMHDVEPGIFVMFDNGKSKQLSITNHGPEIIKVPYGKLAIQKIQHEELNSGRVTILWCAESLHFLPVRIEQRKKGKLSVRAELIDYQLH